MQSEARADLQSSAAGFSSKPGSKIGRNGSTLKDISGIDTNPKGTQARSMTHKAKRKNKNPRKKREGTTSKSQEPDHSFKVDGVQSLLQVRRWRYGLHAQGSKSSANALGPKILLDCATDRSRKLGPQGLATWLAELSPGKLRI